MRKTGSKNDKVCSTMIIVLILVAIIFTTQIFFNVKRVNASSKYQLSYQSIEIESGDTLWTIAEEYRGELSTKECVAVISEANGILDTDSIQSGDFLLVPDFIQQH